MNAVVLGKKKMGEKKASYALSYPWEKAYVFPMQANSMQAFMTVSCDLSIATVTLQYRVGLLHLRWSVQGLLFLWEVVASPNTVPGGLCLLAGGWILKPALWISLNRDEI